MFEPQWYGLDENGEPKRVTVHELDAAFGDPRRIIASETIGDVRVSTAFLVLDHGFNDEGPPTLWETMIFGGEHDGFQERYTSAAEARAGHVRAVVMVVAGHLGASGGTS